MKADTGLKQRGAVLAFTLLMLALLTMAGVTMVSQNKQDFLMTKNSRQQTQALSSVEQLLTNAETALRLAVVKTTLGDVKIHSPCNNPAGTAPACGNPPIQPVVQDPVTGLTIDASLACTPAANADGTTNPLLKQTQIVAGSKLPDTAGVATLPPEATITSVTCLQDDAALATQSSLIENLCSTFDKATGKTYCYPNNLLSSGEECEVSANNPIPVPKDGNWGPYLAVDPATHTEISGTSVTGTDAAWACYKSFKGDAQSAVCPYEIYTLQITFTDTNGASRSIESKYGINCGNL